MSKLRLFWDFKSDAATVTASGAAANYPAANVAHPHLARPWKTEASSADEWIKFDLGAAASIAAFAVLSHDLTAGDSALYLEGNASDAWGAPSLSRSVTYRAGALVEFFSPATYRWWRFRFTKATAGAVRSLGRVVLGPYYELARNVGRSGFRLGLDDPSAVLRSDGGQVWADELPLARTLAWVARGAPQAQLDAVEACYRGVGQTRPFLTSIDHDTKPVDWLVYGTAEERLVSEYRGYNGAHLWDVGLRVREAF